jgi:hypothetical protein
MNGCARSSDAEPPHATQAHSVGHSSSAQYYAHIVVVL